MGKDLAQKYIPLAKSIARKIAPDYHDPEELEGVALLALVETVTNNTHTEAQIVEHIKLRVRGSVVNFLTRGGTPDENNMSLDDMEHLAYYDPSAGEDKAHLKIREAVAKLPCQHKNIVQLYYYDGMTQGEIADKLGVTQQTISLKLQEVTDHLRKKMCPSGNTPEKRSGHHL